MEIVQSFLADKDAWVMTILGLILVGSLSCLVVLLLKEEEGE